MAKIVENILLGLIGIATFIYLITYMKTRKYLKDGFRVPEQWGQQTQNVQTDAAGSRVQVGEFGSGRTDESPQIVTSSATVTLTPTQTPYDTEQINDLDDYEMNYSMMICRPRST